MTIHHSANDREDTADCPSIRLVQGPRRNNISSSLNNMASMYSRYYTSERSLDSTGDRNYFCLIFQEFFQLINETQIWLITKLLFSSTTYQPFTGAASEEQSLSCVFLFHPQLSVFFKKRPLTSSPDQPLSSLCPTPKTKSNKHPPPAGQVDHIGITLLPALCDGQCVQVLACLKQNMSSYQRCSISIFLSQYCYDMNNVSYNQR